MNEFLNKSYIWIALVVLFLTWKKWKSIKMKPLIKQYLEQNAIVVDVRSPEEYRGGCCKGSINIPLNTLEARYFELEKTRPIIVCCASGGRSGMALNFLKGKGFEKIINAGSWLNVRDSHECVN